MGVRRGEIYFVDLGEVRHDFGAISNKEPTKVRPVVVLSINQVNDLADTTLVLVSVVPGTSGSNVPRDYPTQIRVPPSASGLKNETVFRAFQIRSVDSRRLGPRRSGFLQSPYLE